MMILRKRPPELPCDVVEKILAHLPPRDVVSAAQVDKVWSQASRAPRLWEHLAARVMPKVAPTPVPSIAKIVSTYDDRLSLAEGILGFAAMFGLFVGGAMAANVGSNRYPNCLADHCGSLFGAENSQACVDGWLDNQKTYAPEPWPADVQVCRDYYNKLFYSGITAAVLFVVGGAMVALTPMVARVKMSALLAVLRLRCEQRREDQLNSQQGPIALKRMAIRNLVKWDKVLIDLQVAIHRRDDKAVDHIIAHRPFMQPWSDATMLENTIQRHNTHAARALMEADHPLGPRCFELALRRNQSFIFCLMVQKIKQENPNVDLSAWICMNAFGKAVEFRNETVVAHAVNALGDLAGTYINANSCAGGASPFFRVAEYRHRELFALMLQRGGDLRGCVSECGISVAQIACQHRGLKVLVMEHLLDGFLATISHRKPKLHAD